MKKFLCLLISAVMIFSLSACMIYSDYDNEYNGKLEIKTEQEVYSKDVEQIKYTITNVSDDEWCYGLYDCLARYVDGEWKLVEPNKRNSGWNDLGYYISPDEPREHVLNLGVYYRLPLPAGEYRVVLLNEAESNTFRIE